MRNATNDFRHIKAAIAKYERWERKCKRLWDTAKTHDETLAACEFEQAGEEEQRLALCQAFFEDTKDVNSLGHCQVINIWALRRFVANGYSWKGVPA